MKTMCPPGYHHNRFVETHALGHMMYGDEYIVYSLPDQTEGRREASLEGASIDLSSKLSLTSGGNVNHYKSVRHSLSTLPVGIGSLLAVLKTNQ